MSKPKRVRRAIAILILCLGWPLAIGLWAWRIGQWREKARREQIATAIDRGDTAVLDKLLVPGVDVNAELGNAYPGCLCLHGVRLLHQAARCGNEEATRRLLELGADPTLQTSMRITPLEYAAANRQAGVVSLLLRREGAELLHTGTSPAELVRLACGTFSLKHRTDEERVLEALEEFMPNNISLEAALGHNDRLKALLERRPKKRYPLTRDSDYPSALHYAAGYSGNRQTIELLVAHGISTKTWVPMQGFPLHVAAKMGNREAALALIEAGAEVDCRDYRDETPLHKAAHYGHEKMVRLLI
jgi:ankyrin repeat protein